MAKLLGTGDRRSSSDDSRFAGYAIVNALRILSRSSIDLGWEEL